MNKPKFKTAEQIHNELYDLIPQSGKNCGVDIIEARCDRWTKEYKKFHEHDRKQYISKEDLYDFLDNNIKNIGFNSLWILFKKELKRRLEE